MPDLDLQKKEKLGAVEDHNGAMKAHPGAMEAYNGAMEAYNGIMEVCKPVVADSHHFDEAPYPDLHWREKLDPCLHQNEMPILNPRHQIVLKTLVLVSL
jgi:hypothetical protein